MSANLDINQRIGLFDSLEQGVVENFTQELTRLKLKKGESLTLDYKENQSLFLIEKGSLEISCKKKKGEKGELTLIVGPGEFCGEFALLSNAPADATATALEASELLEIPYNKFNKLSFSQPAVLINVIRARHLSRCRLSLHVPMH